MATSYTFNYLMKGNKVGNVANVQSITWEDKLIFDSTTYRDTLDGAFLARDVNSVALSANVTGSADLNPVAPNTTRPLVFDAVSPTITVTQIPDPYFEESDEYTHTPPHPLEKTMSYVVFWSEPAGAGQELARVSIDQFISFTTGNFKRL